MKSKRARTDVLEIAYEEHGPEDGAPVILLHGFPYDARTFDEVAPALAADGCRVLVPYLRGYGPTRFLSAATPRSGEQAALGHDLLQFMDALGIARAALAGYDWGGRAACVVAALRPERVRCLLSCTGYNIQNIAASGEPAAAEQEHRFWYQYYFHTERGRAGLTMKRRDVCRLLWKLWSPEWALRRGDLREERRLVRQSRFRRGRDPVLPPSLRLRAGRSGARRHRRRAGAAAQDHGADHQPAWRSRRRQPGAGEDGQAKFFSASYERRVLPRIGHNVPQEAPAATAAALRDLMKGTSPVSNIALIGATGNIGSRVLEEALSRKHTVTAITRDPRKVTARAGMVIRAGSTTDAPALVKILKGHDVVVVSVKWNENDVRRVIDTIRKSGVKRALFVVGAGSLLRKDGKRHYDYMSEKGVQPPTSLPALQAYEEIQKIDDLDWTAISPPASIPAGQRTGKFKRGLDKLIENAKGESRISREDFAVAIVDEIEKPKHIRKRFTVGY